MGSALSAGRRAPMPHGRRRRCRFTTSSTASYHTSPSRWQFITAIILVAASKFATGVSPLPFGPHPPRGGEARKLFCLNSRSRPSPKDAEAAAAKSPSSEEDEPTARDLAESKLSWLTRTRYFQRVIDSSFDTIDADGSGAVTLEELYAGLLLIHLATARYVGAPACRPASRGYVNEIFHLLDVDNSGTLTREEFETVMKILYSQVFTRIVIQWSLALMILPIISKYITKYAVILPRVAHELWEDIDYYLDPLQRLLWKLRAKFLHLIPRWVDGRMGGLAQMALGRIPDGVWDNLPQMLLTLVQTYIALPYVLNRVEDFFRRLARDDKGQTVGRKGNIMKQ